MITRTRFIICFFIYFFFNVNSNAFNFKEAMELAPSSFHSFFYSNYFNWQTKIFPSSYKTNKNLDSFFKDKIDKFSSWSSSEHDHILRHNFQILYTLKKDKVQKEIVLKVENSDLKSFEFSHFLKENNIQFDPDNSKLSFIKYNFHEAVFTIVFQNMSNSKIEYRAYKNKKLFDHGDIILMKIENAFSDRYTPYREHFILQEQYQGTQSKKYYRSYLKVLNLLFLPKKLQDIAFIHKNEWNLNSVTIHTEQGQNAAVGLYFP